MRRLVTSHARSGLSILELMIAITILIVVFGALAVATLSAQGAFRQSTTLAALESDARRAVDRIADELRTAGRDGLVPQPSAPLGSSSLQYQRNEGWVGGAIQWSLPLRLELQPEEGEPANGLDDDEDGVVDEGRLIWTRDAATPDAVSVPWVRGVARFLEGELANGLDDNGNGLVDEAGLSFELDGDTLRIRLTLERAGVEGRVFARTVETSIGLRN